MLRVAFDLDETLGVPLIEGDEMIGWQMRQGAAELLDDLKPHFDLCLWSVSSRRYVNKVLSFGLSRWFKITYSWDELPVRWKDIRLISADVLVDDSAQHRNEAQKLNIKGYIVVPAFGSVEDAANPLSWIQMVAEGIREE